MEVLGAQRSRIAGVVGPAIAQASYEVAQDMRGAFDAEDHRFFAPGRGGHFQFDLAGYVLSRLEAAGVAHRAALAEDTYTQPARFYSYRRATHRGEATYGRQISVIALAAG
jgi:copper oxidase (laccase) domain-containing protein